MFLFYYYIILNVSTSWYEETDSLDFVHDWCALLNKIFPSFHQQSIMLVR